MAKDTHPVGMKVRVVMGVDSNKIATIVDMRLIKTDDRGIPALGRGHYHPINHKEDRAIRYVDGSLDVHNKAVLARLRYVFTIILPDDGKEVCIGAFYTEGDARGFAKRHFPTDYLSLCSYPFNRRPLGMYESPPKCGDPYNPQPVN